MTRDTVIALVVHMLEVATKVLLPLLVAALVVGLLVSILQAVTQIQEMTLSFIPKLAVVALVMVVAGPWMLDQLLGYATALYTAIPDLVG